MKKIVSVLLMGTVFLNSTVSCGLLRPKINVAKFMDESDSNSDSDNTETGEIDGTVNDGLNITGRYDRERNTVDFDVEGNNEKASVDSSNGDRAVLNQDNSAKSSTKGRSEVTTKTEVKEAVDSASTGTEQGGENSPDKDPAIKSIKDQAGLKDTNAEQGNVGGGRKEQCDGCDGTSDAESGDSGSSKKEANFANLDELERIVNEEKAKFTGKVNSVKDGNNQSRLRVSNSAKSLLEDHNFKVEKIKERYRNKGLETERKVKFFTDPRSRLGQEIRDADARFNKNANQTLTDIHKKLLQQADRNAYTGNINGANEFLKGANRLADLSNNPGALPSEVFDPNHRPDYNPGNFDERNERIKAGRIGLDLYDSAAELAADKSPAANEALLNAGTMLDIAVGAARFSTVVDVPLSAMELFTGKTLEFDANGNPMIVEASTVTRAAAALTLGLTAAAFVTTGGLAAVGVAAALGFIPGLMKVARKALGGLSKTEKAAETVADVERTVEKIAEAAGRLGVKSAEDVKSFANVSAKYGRSPEAAAESLREGKGIFGNSSLIDRSALNQSQVNNLKRFEDKLPSGTNPVSLHQEGRNVIFKGEVPGRVPGSKAVYEKVVDSNGKTLTFTKTTYTPDGKIAHIKDKIDGSLISPGELP